MDAARTTNVPQVIHVLLKAASHFPPDNVNVTWTAPLILNAGWDTASQNLNAAMILTAAQVIYAKEICASGGENVLRIFNVHRVRHAWHPVVMRAPVKTRMIVLLISHAVRTAAFMPLPALRAMTAPEPHALTDTVSFPGPAFITETVRSVSSAKTGYAVIQDFVLSIPTARRTHHALQ